MAEKDQKENTEADDIAKKKKNTWALIGVSTLLFGATLGGICRSVTAAKKSDPRHFDAGLGEGTRLGLKALATASLYAVGTVGLLTFVVCKAFDVHSLPEFRYKMETAFKKRVPDIPRPTNPGRSDFASFRELFQYLSDEDDKSKKSDKR